MTTFFICLLTICICIALWSVFIEPKRVKIEHVSIQTTKHLPKKTFTILHLSDLHFKKKDPWKINVLRKVSLQQYDLVLITGDSIDEMEGLHSLIKGLNMFNPTYGKYYVLGNHDHYSYTFHHALGVILRRESKRSVIRKDLELFSRTLHENNCHLLHNSHITIDELNISIAGIDDYYAGRSDIKKACQDINAQRFNILLSHTPDPVMFAPNTLIDLALSGHTHGGQICLPFIGAMVTHSILPGKHASGFVTLNDIPCYVSRGLSAFKLLPFRFLCRPEVTFISISQKD
ncbi:MAG: metallophosphoesterase [Candidatus Ancaeobacter aquaticus]|nr:metallophosphoesterase [Candidatus Ancaeobacter aquaticus]